MRACAWSLGSVRTEGLTSPITVDTALPAATGDDRTWLGVLLGDWTSFSDAYLMPLGKLAVPFLAVLAVLLVVSRLLVIWVPKWSELEENRALVLAAGLLSMTAGAALMSLLFADIVVSPLTPEVTLAVCVAGVGLGLGALVWAAELAPSSRPKRLTSTAGGAVLLVSLAVLAVRQYPGDNVPPAVEKGVTPGAGLFVGIMGVVMTAWWLATRLRLEVKVSDAGGKESPGDAGLIVALLGELGVQKPRGLEVPRGTDVTALDGAFATLPDSPIAKTIKSIVSGIAGVTPWTASIEGGETTRAVCLSRNGRSVDSAIVRLESLGFAKAPEEGQKLAEGEVEATPEAALRMAAAFILTTLATTHNSIKTGLAGATDWRSVGLHYIAATELDGPERETARRSLLALAVDHDPDNLAAQLAFRHALDRDSTDAVRLVDYREWLRRFESRAHDCDATALELRARYTRTVIAVNAVFAIDGEGPVEALQLRRRALVDAHQELTEVLQGLCRPDGVAKDPDLRGLVASVRQGLIGLRRLLGSPEDLLLEPESPTGLYNLACYHASHDGPTWRAASDLGERQASSGQPGAGDSKAVALLQLAAADPKLKKWIPVDPQLAELRARPGYAKAFLADPRSDFLELTSIKPLVERLRYAGLHHPSTLSGSTPAAIRLALASAPQVAIHVLDLARLHDDVPAALDRWRVEIVDRLDEQGRGSVARLAVLPRQKRSELATSLAADLLKSFRPGHRPTPPPSPPPAPMEVLLEAVSRVVASHPGLGPVWETTLLGPAVGASPADPPATNGSRDWDEESLAGTIRAWLLGIRPDPG